MKITKLIIPCAVALFASVSIARADGNSATHRLDTIKGNSAAHRQDKIKGNSVGHRKDTARATPAPVATPAPAPVL